MSKKKDTKKRFSKKALPHAVLLGGAMTMANHAQAACSSSLPNITTFTNSQQIMNGAPCLTLLITGGGTLSGSFTTKNYGTGAIYVDAASATSGWIKNYGTIINTSTSDPLDA